MFEKYKIDTKDIVKFYEYIFKNISDKCFELNNRSYGDNINYNIDNIKNKIDIFYYIFSIFTFSKYHQNINEYYNDSIYDEFINYNFTDL